MQEVFSDLLQELPKFRYQQQGSFRGWLRTVTLNKWRDSRKRRPLPMASGAEGRLSGIASADGSEVFEEQEYRQYLISRALELMQADFQPATWKACWEHTVSGRPADEVAQELGMSVGAVYAAKFRVLERLRQELAGLLD